MKNRKAQIATTHRKLSRRVLNKCTVVIKLIVLFSTFVLGLFTDYHVT